MILIQSVEIRMDTSETDDRLVQLYRDYVGDPEEAVDIYAGFALFFGGIALWIVGVGLFLVSGALTTEISGYYAVREIAAVAGAVGLPALLSGIVVLLPVDRRALYLSGAGALVCLGAIGLFVWAYPYNWNVPVTPDYSAMGVAVYSVGLAGVIAATGAALVAHSVERASPAAGGATAQAEAEGAEETVTDEQVRADIERELADADLSWGGIAKTEHRRLELNTDQYDDIDMRGMEIGSAKTSRSTSAGVDDAVSGLRQLQGGEKKTASGSGTDTQASALRELRQQRQQEQQQQLEQMGWFERVKHWLSGSN